MAIPQTIKDLANKVRTAVYGKDVRESLAKSMEETGNLADETKTRQDSLETQFQTVLDETTGKDVVSAPEILAARVDSEGVNHSNLKERLDQKETEVSALLAQIESKVKFVTYELFGVDGRKKYFNKADGNYYLDEAFTQIYSVDDGIKIKEAHDFANANNLPIINVAGEYVIRNTRNIEILTGVDWGYSTFHIDEKVSSSHVFIVKSRYAPIDLTSTEISTLLPYLKKGTTSIPALSQYENHLIKVVDDATKIAIRSGDNANSGHSLQDIFYVDKGGKLIGELAWTFSNVTKITAVRCDDNYLKVNGGTFLLSGNLYSSVAGTYSRNGIRVNRSRVIIDSQYIGLEQGVTDNPTASSSGFHDIQDAFDVKIREMKNIPRKQVTTSGTYGLSATNVLNLYLEEINADSGEESDWGYMYTGFVKNLHVDKCNLNRIDAHIQGWNFYISNTNVGKTGITLVGGGDLFLENTTVNNRQYLGFRSDYGSKWDGDIRIKNGKIKVFRLDTENADSMILGFGASNHDYGYDVTFGQTIYVDGFTFDYTGASDTIKQDIAMLWYFGTVTSTAARKIILPKSMTFRNIRVKGRSKGVRFGNFEKPNKVLVFGDNNFAYDETNEIIETNADITLEDIDTENILFNDLDNTQTLMRFVVYSTDVYDTNSYVPKISINRCKNINLKPMAAIFSLDMLNSSVCGLLAGNANISRCEVNHINCTYKPNLTQSSLVIRVMNNLMSFVNTTFYPININGVVDISATRGGYGVFDLNSSNRKVNGTHVGSTLSSEIYNMSGITVIKEITEALNNHNRKQNSRLFNNASSTALRPTEDLYTGRVFFDTSLKKPVWWNGSNWVDANGTIV